MSNGRVDMGSADVVNERECLKNFDVHLTPPRILERLCRGEVQVICKEAIFLEELLELAERLGRRHMIVTDRCLKYGVY